MTIIRRMLISYQNHSAPNEVQPFFSPDLIRAVHWNLFLVLTAASGFTRILSIPFYFVVCICFVFGLQITIRNLCEKVLRMGHSWYWAEKKWFVLFLKFTTFVFDILFFGGIIWWNCFSANGRKKLKLYHRLEQLKDIYFIHTKTCTIPNVETNLLLFEMLLMHQIYSVLSWNWSLLCKKMRKSNEIVRMIPKEKIWKLYGQRKLTIQAKKEKRIEKKRILSKIWKSICLYCHCKQYEKKWNLQTI